MGFARFGQRGRFQSGTTKTKMKKSLLTTIVAAFAVVHTASAVTIQSVAVDTSGYPGDITFDEFAYPSPGNSVSIPVLPGVSLTYDNLVLVQSNNDSNGAPPFPQQSGNYLSVTAGGTATFSFDDPGNKSFGFQWGSVDSYNTITFSGSEGAFVFTGSDILNPANGLQLSGGSAFVTFTGVFDTVTLTSSANSFEIDNVKVPDGGMTVAMLGLAMGGIAAVRRRMAMSA